MKLLLALLPVALPAASFAPVARRRAALFPLRAALHDVEAGTGASWAGARYGDPYQATGQAWSPSTTHGTSSSNAMDGPRSASGGTRGHAYSRSTTHERSASLATHWSGGDHADRGNDAYEWAGARFGDYANIAQRASPTASQWHE